MALRTIECSACGTAVPYGRLSCPECGELLASVAGAARHLTSVAEVGGSAMQPAASEPVPVAAVEPDPIEPDPIEPEPVGPPPGSYVPPAPAPVQPTVTQPAGLPAPARAWGGIGNAAGATSGSTAVSDSSTDRDSLSLTDPARRAEAIGWLAVAGAAVGAAGFLLPWARTVIGADGVGYLDTWGFAGPGHPLVVLGLLAVLALAVVKNPIPAWARLGIPGLAFGSMLVGMLWPYVFGPLGPLPGAYLSLFGAVVLVVAAIASLASDRHAPAQTGV